MAYIANSNVWQNVTTANGMDYDTNRHKWCQVFKTGQLNSVASEPEIYNRLEPNQYGLNPYDKVVLKQNPLINALQLESKPGYPHELMTRLYERVRVCANSYTIRISMPSGYGKSRDLYQPNRFYLQYGIYWTKEPALDVDRDNPAVLGRDAEEQFARDVVNRPFEQLRLQPGVKTMMLTPKPKRIKVFIPSEKMANKRLNERWKWNLQYPTADDYIFTSKTTPSYTTGTVEYTDGNDVVHSVKVPYYPWNDKALPLYPMFWFMIVDLGNAIPNVDSSVSPGHAKFNVQIKEKKYHVYSSPKFISRSQQFSQGLDASNRFQYLPEHARIYPSDVAIATRDNVSNAIHDFTSNIRGSYTDVEMATFVSDNNTGKMRMDINAIL